jgi:hypothetical protein
MKTQTKTLTKQSTPNAPVTFSIDVMLPAEREGELSRIVKAGAIDHPWQTVADVPEHLRQWIGKPRTGNPPDSEIQHWVPQSVLRAEREAFEALNSRDEMNPTLAEELERRDRDYLRDSKARNETETEIDRREEQDRRRLVAELEREAREKLKGKYE